MQTKFKIRKLALSAAICVLLATFVLTAPCQAALTLGHQLLLEKGLQISTVAMPTDVIQGGGTFDVNLFKQVGFTTINLWDYSYSYDYFPRNNILPGGASALNFSRVVTSGTASAICSSTYTSNIISIQLGDEQPIDSYALSSLKTNVDLLKAQYPNAMIYTNQSPLYNEDSSGNNLTLTSTLLNAYVQTIKPGMLSFTEYPFRFSNYYGGSPRYMYNHIELYRKAGLAGLTGDGSQPIPVSMFAQTYATTGTATYINHRQPTESEFRLQQFAGWAAGMKMVTAFIYENMPSATLDSMFFSGTAIGSQTPTTQFTQYAELNRQSKNLGNALVRLISTNLYMKRGSYKNSSGVTTTNAATSIADWSASTSADPYLTGITVTNSGTCNSSLSGDVVIGYLKPLDSSLVASGCENDVYFMVVNGLTDGTATTAAACTQLIHLTFNWNLTNINGLQRLNRDTGLVEDVELTYLGSAGCYGLDLTLDGGTGDLFKYNTGSAFVPEPSTIVLLFVGMTCLTAHAWRRRKHC